MQLEAQLCPCSSTRLFAECCQKIIAGTKLATTPLELMRSRYVAHVFGDEQYLMRSMLGKISPENAKQSKQIASTCTWTKLAIIAAPAVLSGQDHGVVEFNAHYTLNGIAHVMHERSNFVKIAGRWYYLYHQFN